MNADTITTDLDCNGAWRLYWGSGPLPADAIAEGTVTRGSYDTGALILLASGLRVQGNAGTIRTLPATFPKGKPRFATR